MKDKIIKVSILIIFLAAITLLMISIFTQQYNDNLTILIIGISLLAVGSSLIPLMNQKEEEPKNNENKEKSE